MIQIAEKLQNYREKWFEHDRQTFWIWSGMVHLYVCVCVGVINVLMLNVKYMYMYMCVINVCSYSEPRLHSIATIY